MRVYTVRELQTATRLLNLRVYIEGMRRHKVSSAVKNSTLVLKTGTMRQYAYSALNFIYLCPIGLKPVQSLTNVNV